MEKIYKQYAVIASKWVPNDPIKAFIPFFLKYVIEEKINKIKTQNIIVGLKRFYNIDFSYQLVCAILNRLKKDGITRLENKCWLFSYQESNITKLTNHDIDLNVEKIIESFKKYCVTRNVRFDNYEQIIGSFFEMYDHELMLDTLGDTKIDNKQRIVADFLLNLKEDNIELFDFACQIAQGSIVKSAIFFDKSTLKILKDKKVYLDTRILLKILGFNENFLMEEYRKFIKQILECGGKPVISSFVFDELYQIIEGCADHIEDDNFDYLIANDALLYFKKENYDRLSVKEVLATLKSTFASLSIEVENVEIDELKKHKDYDNDFARLYTLIEQEYAKQENEYNSSIDCDVNSILLSYYARGGNKLSQFCELKCIFLTQNNTLIKIARDFINEKLSSLLTSVLSDSYLGVLIFHTNDELKAFSKLKLIGYCSQCHKLTTEEKHLYIKKVDECKKKGTISEHEFFLLKNSDLVDEKLSESFDRINNSFNLSEILKKIKEDLISDAKKKWRMN